MQMRPATALLFLIYSTFLVLALPLARDASVQYPINPSNIHSKAFPSVRTSAILARRLLRLSRFGTLSTVFPNHPSAWPPRPSHLSGLPIGLPEYVADCERQGRLPSSPGGNPTLLAFDIATNFRNAAAGSNVSLTLQWVKPNEGRLPLLLEQDHVYNKKALEEEMDNNHYSQAAMPRIALLGHIEIIHSDNPTDNSTIEEFKNCFVSTHPDAAPWVPDVQGKIHDSHWARLVVEQAYWVGGFGNVAYIGWIPMDIWRSISETDIEQAKLPGERG